MTSLEITTHGSVPRAAATRARQLAPAAAREVERHFGRLPRTRMVLTGNSDGIAVLALEAETTLVPEVTGRAKTKWLRTARRNARGVFGHTLLDPQGGILVLIDLPHCESAGELPATLVHELIHAWQLSRPGVREAHLQHMRHEFGIEPMPRRDARAHARLIERHEKEAHRLEAQLASQLTH